MKTTLRLMALAALSTGLCAACAGTPPQPAAPTTTLTSFDGPLPASSGSAEPAPAVTMNAVDRSRLTGEITSVSRSSSLKVSRKSRDAAYVDSYAQ